MINWTTEFTIKVKEFDEQHEALALRINDLYALINNNNQNQVEIKLNELHDCTKAHFKKEEDIMADMDYPEYITHTTAHDKLVSHLKNIKDECSSGKNVRIQIMLLDDWLIDHILLEDKKLGVYIMEERVVQKLINNPYISIIKSIDNKNGHG